MADRTHAPHTPMPPTRAGHLLNPLRSLVLSPRALVGRLGLDPAHQVLELGPGPGYYSPALARAIPQGNLVLVDIQPLMLELARKRLEALCVHNVEYRLGDAIALPAADASFDVAVLVAVLGEVPDRAAALRELRRVLKAGGLLSITEMPCFDPDALGRNDLEAAATAAGFRVATRHGGGLQFTLGLRLGS